MRKAIDQDTLAALVATAAARDFRAVRRGSNWMLETRVGGFWLPVRSGREPVRLWLSLTALQRFAEGVGIRAMIVEW